MNDTVKQSGGPLDNFIRSFYDARRTARRTGELSPIKEKPEIHANGRHVPDVTKAWTPCRSIGRVPR